MQNTKNVKWDIILKLQVALGLLVLLTACTSPSVLIHPAGTSGPPSEVPSGVSLNGTQLSLSTPNLVVIFDNASIVAVRNPLTGGSYQSNTTPWIDLTMLNPPSDNLSPGSWKLIKDTTTGQTEGQLTLKDSTRTVVLTVGIDSSTQEIFFRISGQSTDPGVQSVIWGIPGLSLQNAKLVLPAQAGIVFDSNSPYVQYDFEYPTHWEAQLAIYQAQQGGFYVYANDPKPWFKQLLVGRQTGSLDMGFQTFAVAPYITATQTPAVEWRLKGFQGDWRSPAGDYSKWMHKTWPRPSSDTRPSWWKNIDAIATVENPDPTVLQPLASDVDPTKTLIYLVNWRQDGFDVNYPDYTPATGVGTFISQAHSLGFRVILHMNALGVSNTNSNWSTVSSDQLRDPGTDNLLWWPWGLWPAGSSPPSYINSFGFISPATPVYRNLFINSITNTIQTIQPDGIHLDAGGVLVNDGNGLINGMTSLQGMQALAQELHQAFPHLAFSYESLTETMDPYIDFAQRWAATFPANPIGTYLFGNDVTFYGFLDQPGPDEPGFIDYMKRYEMQGVLPTIPASNATDLSNPSPGMKRLLNLVSLWQKYNFKPDWTSNWGTDLFRYISSDGMTTATLQNSGNVISLKAAGQTVYQRVHDTSQIQTSDFIANWPAYTDSTILGLDPSRQYWLESGQPRPVNLPHLTSLPTGMKVGSDTLVTPDYAYFQIDPITPSPWDFAGAFGNAKTGIIVNGQDYPLSFGGTASVTQQTVGGVTRDPSLLLVPPYNGVIGATYAEYQVAIPQGNSVQLQFDDGISDFSTQSDGATFAVWVNGKELWRQDLQLGAWKTYHVDMTPYAGQTVKLRFIVAPGPTNNPIDDLGCWSNIRFGSNYEMPAAKVDFALPSGTTPVSVTGSSQVQASSPTGNYQATLDLPSKLFVFDKLPPVIALGSSLLSLPFTTWLQYSEGIPVPGIVEDSGQVTNITSGGVTKLSAIAHSPQNGKAILAWAVQLPPNARTLNVSAGLDDGPSSLNNNVPYTGVGFSVRVNDEQLWDQTVQTRGWFSTSVDVSQWAGQNVVIELVTDSLGSSTFDWSNWADLTIM